MSMTHRSRALPIVLAWMLVPLPVLGALILLTGTSHQPWGDVAKYGGDSWHTFVTVIFAIGFAASAIINATEVSMASAIHGGLARRSAYVGWQTATLALAIAWGACLYWGGDYHPLEAFVALILIVTSCVTCFYATRD